MSPAVHEELVAAILVYPPSRAEAALSLALRLVQDSLGPAEVERRILALADELAAADRELTRAETELLTVGRALRGEP